MKRGLSEVPRVLIKNASFYRYMNCARYSTYSKDQEEIVTRDEWYGKKAGSDEPTLQDVGKKLDYYGLIKSKEKDIETTMEMKQFKIFINKLRQSKNVAPLENGEKELAKYNMTASQAKRCFEASLITSVLHLESRIAALVGQGFYTIGPAGEELLSVIGVALEPTDAMALHYRHLGAQVARQLQQGKSVEDIILDRARGHCVSVNDPVTGGVHCSIGGGDFDFLVTSTLASQAPPAVGRALGSALAKHLNIPSPFVKRHEKGADRKKDGFVSFVSVGDGSVNHAHFLSAVNLAEYTQHRGYRCPVVFAISNNNICISLKGNNWLEEEFVKKFRMKCFFADGQNMFDNWQKTKQAIEYSKKTMQPCTIVYSNLPRRFGHAATDRQIAYLSQKEIEEVANTNPLIHTSQQLVEMGVYSSLSEIADYTESLFKKTQEMFNVAVHEPKISTREEMLSRVSAPLYDVFKNPACAVSPLILTRHFAEEEPDGTKKKKNTVGLQVMRKHMTKVIDESLERYKNLVYFGEDVVHGGYYLVSDGLAKKYGMRVRDFPPEETNIVGAGIGYAQAGLLPVVEIPYAKYLDCAADMFYEAILANWLSNGKQPNGMMIRLQGFDKGLFGGNFHTHNMLHIPPGLDVVCYSNGPDYARGFRYSLQQAKKGRVVMSVDSTALLNLRHCHGKDNEWQYPYTKQNEVLPWDSVMTYGTGKRLAIVTYGNAVITSLMAKEELLKTYGIDDVTVIDCPYLSDVPAGLRQELPNYENIVFADVCKFGQNPLSYFATKLHSDRVITNNWECVAAPRTYNPLGSVITFTSQRDIVEACLRVVNK